MRELLSAGIYSTMFSSLTESPSVLEGMSHQDRSIGVVATDKAKLHLLHLCTGQNSLLSINTSIGVLVDSPYWICLVRTLKNPHFDALLQVVSHIQCMRFLKKPKHL